MPRGRGVDDDEGGDPQRPLRPDRLQARGRREPSQRNAAAQVKSEKIHYFGKEMLHLSLKI